MTESSHWFLVLHTILLFDHILGDCPNGTVNYNNESCYLFLGQDVTAQLWKNIWFYPTKEHSPQWATGPVRDTQSSIDEMGPYLTPNGVSLGEFQLDLTPCVWDRDQAFAACEDFQLVDNKTYGHLANNKLDPDRFSKWHLPRLKTYDEDDWLHEQIVQRKAKMGTNIWIDLQKRLGKYYWNQNEQAYWIRRPAGIDRWWERCNVLMANRSVDETLCYELHTNYVSMRRPFMPLDVRGWHPRVCHGAYEQESELDSDEDFTIRQLSEAENYWFVAKFTQRGVGRVGNRCYYGDDNFCVLPEVLKKDGGRSACEEPVKRPRGKFRMRLAPIGVACEIDMNVTKTNNEDN